MARINTTLPEVLEAVAKRLRDQLEFGESRCFWALDRGEEPPPTAADTFLIIKPDGGTFDAGLFVGGGTEQLTDDTGLIVDLYSLLMLDRGGRDKEGLFHAAKGLYPLATRVVKALAGHDLVIDDDGNTCLRELILPAGHSQPRVMDDNRGVSMTVTFNLSFDWNVA